MTAGNGSISRRRVVEVLMSLLLMDSGSPCPYARVIRSGRGRAVHVDQEEQESRGGHNTTRHQTG